MKKIVFICTGNVCRSPMAEHYMQGKIKELKKDEEYIIDSCGIYANPGEKATKNAIEAIKEYGIDMESHRAKNIYQINLEDFDLIIGLTNQHKENIIRLFPTIKNKVYTLKEYVDPSISYKDIDDPWGFNIYIYKSCAKEIVDYVDKLIKKF